MRRGIPALLLAVRLVHAQPDVPPSGSSVIGKILEGAHAQVGVTVHYDPSYRRIAYPGGDVSPERGVCTDVVIRAFRNAGIDLQVLVHEDMRSDFGAYPRNWGLDAPDPNIDHRRVPNLATYFRRKWISLPISGDAAVFLPGDLVTWRLPGGSPHIGLVSDRSDGGRPLIVHNLGAGTRVEDILFAYPVTGHYRYRHAARGGG